VLYGLKMLFYKKNSNGFSALILLNSLYLLVLWSVLLCVDLDQFHFYVS